MPIVKPPISKCKKQFCPPPPELLKSKTIWNFSFPQDFWAEAKLTRNLFVIWLVELSSLMLPEPFYSELYFVFVFLVFVFTSRIWWRLWRLLLDAGSALLYSQFPRSLGVDLGPARLIFGIFCLTYLCVNILFVFLYTCLISVLEWILVGLDLKWATI